MLGRQRTQVRCCFVYNKTIVWRDIWTGTPGISCASHLGEVRIRIISQQDYWWCFACFHRDGLCPISVSEVARRKRLSRLGFGWSCTRYKRQSRRPAPHHRWTGSFARASTSYSQCRAVSSTSCSSPFINGVVHSTHLPRAALLVCMCLCIVESTYRCMHKPCTVHTCNHPHGNTVPSSATKRETRSTRTRRGFSSQMGHAGGSACGRITDDAQSLRRVPVPTHTPEHPPLLHPLT